MLMAQIQRAQRLLANRDSLAEEIRVRSERLHAVASYRGAADTCPTNDSIAATEGDVLAGGAVGPRVPNVLAEDTWDLFRVLLR